MRRKILTFFCLAAWVASYRYSHNKRPEATQLAMTRASRNTSKLRRMMQDFSRHVARWERQHVEPNVDTSRFAKPV